jgi:hypothetical protein
MKKGGFNKHVFGFKEKLFYLLLFQDQKVIFDVTNNS